MEKKTRELIFPEKDVYKVANISEMLNKDKFYCGVRTGWCEPTVFTIFDITDEEFEFVKKLFADDNCIPFSL